ncbi:TetR/AcrR family transcriptional regulator [Vibrio sp. MarTm2]|uniref:TetR family transcriptional regulator n=3 Tax=Vibrio TaxID=662 RepID=A0A0A5JNG4_PHOS4|nr:MULTISPECIES: TetR/AcrR family transcriptional regulator [Vibrio]EED27745.1 transcriptional regulator [Vibrio sp. 16]KGY09468.1 TetR family transcriptional regulator [Vibrio sinaloensis]KHA60552.1 TetR family transcriptional regulator [Vibrio variabilis]KHD24732.1 TetR family transcriptional regulator [Vibrio caribbeanicus]KHT40326.1 TetR family transcriptional regulator [Vibrio sinaloensis]
MFGFSCSKNDKSERSGGGGALSKKQQAIADREVELTLLAKSIVQEQGWSNLTMDKLTAASAYSKGTIYNHFSSKEDAVIALCIHSLKSEAILFARAAAFEGTTREKVMAMHVGYRIYARMEPVLSTCAIMAKSPWVLEKASPERVKELNELEEQVIGHADLLVNTAVEQGDLKFSPGIGSDAIVYANWSIAFGSNALNQNASNSHCIKRIQDPFSALHNANMLLDGLNWKPLSSEWDYRKTWQRVEQEMFSQEIEYLESVGR